MGFGFGGPRKGSVPCGLCRIPLSPHVTYVASLLGSFLMLGLLGGSASYITGRGGCGRALEPCNRVLLQASSLRRWEGRERREACMGRAGRAWHALETCKVGGTGGARWGFLRWTMQGPRSGHALEPCKEVGTMGVGGGGAVEGEGGSGGHKGGWIM